jgi:hypothetical protein
VREEFACIYLPNNSGLEWSRTDRIRQLWDNVNLRHWELNDMSLEENQKLREKALAILHRAERDEEFAQRLKTDPLGMMTEQDIPHRTAEVMLHYDLCTDTTCWITQCPDSCYVTIIHDV